MIKPNRSRGRTVLTDIYYNTFLEFFNKGSKALEPTNESLGGFGLDSSKDFEQALSIFIESENAAARQSYFMGDKTKQGTWRVVTEIILSASFTENSYNLFAFLPH